METKKRDRTLRDPEEIERRHRGERFRAAGGEWVYRYPFFQFGRFRVRRRNKTTGKVECITLDAKSLPKARDEVLDKAKRDDEAARVAAAHRLLPGKVGAILKEWVATLDVRPATLTIYKANVDLFARLLGAERDLSTVTYSDIENLFTKTWKKRSGRTKIGHRGLLARFFDWAIVSGYAAENFAKKVKIQKVWQREARKAAREGGQALTLDEARKLLRFCRDPFEVDTTPEKFRETRKEVTLAPLKPPEGLFPFVFISLRTGLRLGNVLGTEDKPPLRWGMIDLEKGTLSIEAKWMKNDLDFKVPLHAELLAWLRERAAALGQPPRATQPVVPGIVAGTSLRTAFEGALKRAGLDGRKFRIHDLRHSFVTWLGESCTHSVMQILAGHAPASVTDRYGKHIKGNLDVLRVGINSLPPLLAGEAAPAPSAAATK